MVGCTAAEDPPHYTGQGDGGVGRDASPDLLPHVDLYPPLLDTGLADSGKPDAGCKLGTVDNCSSCGDVCPPGKDTTATTRVCENSKCDIQCLAEYYDVNGSAGDGCEANDDLPIHAGQSSALNIGKVSDCDKTKTKSAKIPSDGRSHVFAPISRPNGRDDWFSIFISDDSCITEAKVTALFSNLPTKAQYTVQAFFKCKNGKSPAGDSKSGYGGSVLFLTPSSACTTGSLGDDSGTLYIKVSKTGGPHSENPYSLSILP